MHFVRRMSGQLYLLQLRFDVGISRVHYLRPQIYQSTERWTMLSYVFYHRLRGSASPVLTATGFVNGKGQFSTPHRIDTPQPITKKLRLRRRPLWLCQIRCISVHGGLLGTWVKYNHNYFYLCPFLRNSPTGQTRRRIFTHDGSNDAKMCPFLKIFLHCSQFRGSKTPKTPILGRE